MRIGLASSVGLLRESVADIVRAEERGFALFSMAQVFGRAGDFGVDPLLAFAAAAGQTRRIEMLSGVVPIFAHHPSGMAQMAVAAGRAAEGRFALGLGVGHKPWIEEQLGIAFDRPVARMREFLAILRPLLDGAEVDFAGDFYTFRGRQMDTGHARIPLLVAALGPAMLRMSAEFADGTVLAQANPRAITEHVLPAWRSGSRTGSDPRIVLSLPIALTNDHEAARAAINARGSYMAALPSYTAMLRRSGVEAPADVALIGDEADLERGMRALAEAGVTDLCTGGADERTLTFLAAYAASSR
ncbi:MAG: TIGR03564 family F420-dependent LLM class oxidoreductase [Dehalococcoidia bacterium]